MRDSGDPDRPATLLLLAQALLFRYGREYDESTVKQIEGLLAEIHPDGSRNRQTADTILRTCRFYQGINSGNLTQVDNLLWDLDRNAYAPPYGFFDWPHMLHKLGVALWARFQLSMSLDDLDKSIALNKEALHLVPDEHCDQANIITCLGISFLRLLVARGDITDIDMSAGIVQLGEMVVRELDSIPSAGRATYSVLAKTSRADQAYVSCTQSHPLHRLNRFIKAYI